MKFRETNLSDIVKKAYVIPGNGHLPAFISMPSELRDILHEVYKNLGGTLNEAPFKFGSWDIVTKKFIIELDEEQHFNRYRSITLKSPLYADYQRFNVGDYNKYCSTWENSCFKKAKHGGYWTNASTERQFGEPGLNGDLSGNGSPRWKQRAYYDFCKDLYSKTTQIPLLRFSIYDKVDTNFGPMMLGNALESMEENAIIKFIETRIKQI